MAQGCPGPRLLARALNLIEADAAAHESQESGLRTKIDRAVDALHGGTHNVTHGSFESSIREFVDARIEARAKARDAREAAAAIAEHLAGNAAAALGDPEAIANGLHSKAILAESSRIAADPGLRALDAELAEVRSQVDALGMGGKLIATLRSDEIVTRKKELEAAIAERKRELFAALGAPAADVVNAAAAGDPAAIERIAIEALEDPKSFPAGTAGRLLDLQAEALCLAPRAVVRALSPPPLKA